MMMVLFPKECVMAVQGHPRYDFGTGRLRRLPLPAPKLHRLREHDGDYALGLRVTVLAVSVPLHPYLEHVAISSQGWKH